MFSTSTIAVRAGHLDGVAFWDHPLQSYVALLRLFDGNGLYPPPFARHGTRKAEFVTPDALANHLTAQNLLPDAETLGQFALLGEQVAESEGAAEFVGLTSCTGERSLHLLTPSRELLGLNPRLAHDDYRVNWGDAGPATVETARLMCEQAWVRGPAQDTEAFALGLAFEHLSEAGDDFSLDANSLCDWYLTDEAPSTSLSTADIQGVRGRVEGPGRQDRTVVGG